MFNRTSCCCDKEFEYGLLIRNERIIYPYTFTLAENYPWVFPSQTPEIIQQFPEVNVFFFRAAGVELAPGLSGISGGVNGLSADYTQTVRASNGIILGRREFVSLDKVKLKNSLLEYVGSSKDLYINKVKIRDGFEAGISPPGKDAEVAVNYNLILPKELENEDVIVPQFEHPKNYFDQFCDGNSDCNITPELNNIFYNLDNGAAFYKGDKIFTYSNKKIISDVYTTLLQHSQTYKVFNNFVQGYNGNIYSFIIYRGHYSWNLASLPYYTRWLKESYTVNPPFAIDGNCCPTQFNGDNPWAQEGCNVIPFKFLSTENVRLNTKTSIDYNQGVTKLNQIIQDDIASDILSKSPIWFCKAVAQSYINKVLTLNFEYVRVIITTPPAIVRQLCTPSNPVNYYYHKPKVLLRSEVCRNGRCCDPSSQSSVYNVFLTWPGPYNQIFPLLNPPLFPSDTCTYSIVKFCKNKITDSNTGKTKTILSIMDEYSIQPQPISVHPGQLNYLFEQDYDNYIELTTPPAENLGTETYRTGTGQCCIPPKQEEPIGRLCKRTRVTKRFMDVCSTCCDFSYSKVSCVPLSNGNNCWLVDCTTTNTDTVISSLDGCPDTDIDGPIIEQTCCGNLGGDCPGEPPASPSGYVPCKERIWVDGTGFVEIPAPCGSFFLQHTTTYTSMGFLYKNNKLLGPKNEVLGCATSNNGSDGTVCGIDCDWIHQGRTYMSEYELIDNPPYEDDGGCDCAECGPDVSINENAQSEIDFYLNPPPYRLYALKVGDNATTSGRTSTNKVVINGFQSDYYFYQEYLKIGYTKNDFPDGTNIKYYWLKKSTVKDDIPSDKPNYFNISVVINGNTLTHRLNFNPLKNGQSSTTESFNSGNSPGPKAKNKTPWSTLKTYVKDVYRCSKGITGCNNFAGYRKNYFGLNLGISFDVIGNNYVNICKRLVDWFGITAPPGKENDENEKELAIDIFPIYPLYKMADNSYPDWCFPKYASNDESFSKLFWKYSSKNPDEYTPPSESK
jgi:hypothetical protein